MYTVASSKGGYYDFTITPTHIYKAQDVIINAKYTGTANSAKVKVLIGSTIFKAYDDSNISIDDITVKIPYSSLPVGTNTIYIWFNRNAVEEVFSFTVVREAVTRTSVERTANYYDGGYTISNADKSPSGKGYEAIISGNYGEAIIRTTDLTNVPLGVAISSISIPTIGSGKYAFSFDKRETWKSFINGSWIDITEAEIFSKGMTKSDLSLLTSSDYVSVSPANQLDAICGVKTNDGTTLLRDKVNGITNGQYTPDNDLFIRFLTTYPGGIDYGGEFAEYGFTDIFKVKYVYKGPSTGINNAFITLGTTQIAFDTSPFDWLTNKLVDIVWKANGDYTISQNGELLKSGNITRPSSTMDYVYAELSSTGSGNAGGPATYSVLQVSEGSYSAEVFGGFNVTLVGNPIIKTNIDSMIIGDLIPCKFNTTTNLFYDLGVVDNPSFYFRMVGYDEFDRPKLIADRVVGSFTYYALNDKGWIHGIKIQIGGKQFIIRVPESSRVPYNNYDNEYQKVVLESNCDGAVVPGSSADWSNTGYTTVSSWWTPGAYRTLTNNSAAGSSYAAPSGASGFRPVLIVEPLIVKYLFIKPSGEAFTYSEGVFTSVLANWETASNSAKLAVLEMGSDTIPTKDALVAFGDFKMIALPKKPINKPEILLRAIPKERIVLPKGLIPMENFKYLNNVSIKGNTTATGKCKVFFTFDLINYFYWDGSAFVNVSNINAPASELKTIGTNISDVQSIPKSEWNLKAAGESGIGFAYLPTIEADGDISTTDELTLTVELSGNWDMALPGVDYTYGYPKNDVMRIKILTNGSYKINYFKNNV